MNTPLNNLTVLIDAQHLQQGVSDIAGRIDAELEAKEDPDSQDPILVVVLKGGVFFGVDLLKTLRRPIPLAFVHARSDGQGVVMTSDDQALLRGRELIVVDALMDTGGSLRRLCLWLQETVHPASIRLAVLLHKTVSDPEPVRIDFLGFEVPDVRLVGYGLDEEQRFRGLPAVYTWWKPTEVPRL